MFSIDQNISLGNQDALASNIFDSFLMIGKLVAIISGDSMSGEVALQGNDYIYFNQ